MLISIVKSPLEVIAADTVPNTINYQGRLLNSSSIPLTGSYTFRFSIWTSADWVAGDTTGGGAINTGAGTYAGWNEAQTVTLGSYGLFDLQLGSVTSLPNFSAATHKYIQVEVKASALPDTSYEILDPIGTTGDAVDRKTLAQEAYADNADTLDNADIGTSAGNLATLSAGGMWLASQIPGGTNANSFVVDSNNDAVNPAFQFGAALAETLSWIAGSGWFEFSDDVNILGNLTTTGTINGVSLTAIPFGNLATRAKTERYTPEYPNATVFADGSTNNGNLKVNFEDLGGTNKRNYYEWVTTKGTLQDVDLMITVPLPQDFVSFSATPIELMYQTSNAVTTDNKVDVSVFDSAGASVSTSGGSTLAASSWSTASITFSGTPTFTAGDRITLRIKLSTLNSGYARIADVKFNYNGR